jgi:hypothetical protein
MPVKSKAQWHKMRLLLKQGKTTRQPRAAGGNKKRRMSIWTPPFLVGQPVQSPSTARVGWGPASGAQPPGVTVTPSLTQHREYFFAGTTASVAGVI